MVGFQEATFSRKNLPVTMVQAAIAFMAVTSIFAFGILYASQAIGEEVSKPRTAVSGASAANVLPTLAISSQALEPNLNGMLATGDGGAMIDTQEITGSLPRSASASQK